MDVTPVAHRKAIMSSLAVVIPATGVIRKVELQPGVETLQLLVGGYFEGLPSTGQWQAYGNEDAKILGLPENPRATVFLGSHAGHNVHDTVRGDIVVVGFDEHGEHADTPAEVVTELFQQFG